MILCLITQNIFSRHQAFRLWAITRLGLQPNRVRSPLSERKRNATQDRWMTDESFPFMRLRMLTLICCHVSLWMKHICVYELAWERQKREKKVKERLRVWWWDFFFFNPGFIILLAIKFLIEGSHAISIYPATVLSPHLQHGRCVSRKEYGSPPPSRCTTASFLSQM